MWTSVPQIVVVVMRMSASSGPISGIGRSSRAMRPGSTKMAAFMVRMGRLAVTAVQRVFQARGAPTNATIPGARRTAAPARGSREVHGLHLHAAAEPPAPSTAPNDPRSGLVCRLLCSPAMLATTSIPAPFRVLVVEDDERSGQMLAGLLRRDGFAVDMCSGGLAGLQHLADSPAPDVLVTDLRMPQIDGITVARLAR